MICELHVTDFNGSVELVADGQVKWNKVGFEMGINSQKRYVTGGVRLTAYLGIKSANVIST